ncbi:hypothetical protein NKR19_g4239 [Coniochaeta hoffmannii]|uniref:Uncharacterized protein n=1 Tax=Coniochaeta hoffmannii TaxID=91930 RepID=A0AA38VWL1_9PEZI|nr:hypothetical protein NKR19_g4239 [Coniochaeta hoffmannii]
MQPVVPEHCGEDKRQTRKEVIYSEEGEPKGKGREHHHGVIGKGRQGYNDNDDDAEIMTAIWNGLDEQLLLSTVMVLMCMDEAGRWRIAWGQLAD